jgi:DNA-binding NarL/FixJ family response regulator
MKLTPRETEVVELLRQGLSNLEIAEQLNIGPDTARRYASRVTAKTGVSTTAHPFLGLPASSGWIGKVDLASLGLSRAEVGVLELLCLGWSSKQIARAKGTSPRTIDKHRERLRQKCGAGSTRTLVAWVAAQYAKCGMD